jgi:dienelactone hydrolase
MCHTDIPPGQPTPSLPTDEVQIPVGADEAMPALSIGAADAPAVLIVGDVFGRSPFYEHLAALLAADGLQSLVPDYFFRQGPLETAGDYPQAFARRARLDETNTLEDLRAAIAWLRARSGRTTVGIVGFCMGATFVLDLATGQDDLVAVAYYGFPVPQATLVSPPPRPIDLVDGLRGPVLAFWGDQDDTVGLEHARAYIERARAVDPAFEAEIVPGLGHGFLGSAPLGAPADPGAATWSRAVSHLHAHLDESES